MTALRNTDFLIEVNKGNIPGHSLVAVFGENPAATTNSFDIWAGGSGTNLTWLQAASTLEAISTNAGDTAAGAGARTITVKGLDATFSEVEADIIMNGTSASAATTQTFIRINEVTVKDVGTYTESNLGDITVRVSGAGSIQSVLETNEGRDANTHYTVPAGYTGFALSAEVTMDGNKEVTAHMLARENADGIIAPFSPYRHIHHWEGLKEASDKSFKANHKFLEKTDIWLRGNGATTPHVNVNYELLLVDNTI